MKRIITVICILLCTSHLPAAERRFAEPLDLTGVMQILRPNDAQGVALGITGVAYREGLFAGYSNPAGLIFHQAAAGYSHVPANRRTSTENGLNQEAVCLGIPLKNNYSLAMQFHNLNWMCKSFWRK